MTLRELTMHDVPLAAYRGRGTRTRSPAVDMRRTSAAQAAPAPINAAPDITAPADAPLDCRP
jgi:hypothetical protein